MISREYRRIRISPAVPARDLPFVDAAAVVIALFLAYGIRAAIGSNYAFEWASIAPFVRVALPVSLCALLLSAAAVGLYGRGAADAGARMHIAAAGQGAAVATVVGIYWGGVSPPTAPLVLTAAACLAACLHWSRRLYWHLADRRGAAVDDAAA